jgi:hypothetical protein
MRIVADQPGPKTTIWFSVLPIPIADSGAAGASIVEAAHLARQSLFLALEGEKNAMQ